MDLAGKRWKSPRPMMMAQRVAKHGAYLRVSQFFLLLSLMRMVVFQTNVKLEKVQMKRRLEADQYCGRLGALNSDIFINVECYTLPLASERYR
jgi:hypothetical protein